MNHNGYVHYGCGICAPESWTNFDASPSRQLQRIPMIGARLTRGVPRFPKNVHFGDIAKGLPIPPASCDAIYCSHILEHLSLQDLRASLAHTYEYLKPGGVFRCVLPDLEQLARQYVHSSAEQPSIEFMEGTILGYQQRPQGLRGVLREWLGNSRHLWMWDFTSLAVELRRVGFNAIRRAAFGDAEDVRFRDVEEAARWEKCLGVECRKPA